MDFININSARYQTLPKNLLWVRGKSVPCVRKSLLVLGKESQTLRGELPGVQGHLRLGSPDDISLVLSLRGAALRGVPALGEITAVQPHCRASRAQRNPPLAVVFKGRRGWLIVRWHTKGKVCARLLVPAILFVPWYMNLRGATRYHALIACSGAHWVTLLLCRFPRGVLGLVTAQAFAFSGACTQLLPVWLRGIECIHHTMLTGFT